MIRSRRVSVLGFVCLAVVALGCTPKSQPLQGTWGGKPFGPLTVTNSSAKKQGTSNTIVRLLFDCPAFTPSMIDAHGSEDEGAIRAACPDNLRVKLWLYEPGGAAKEGLYGSKSPDGKTGLGIQIYGKKITVHELAEFRAGKGVKVVKTTPTEIQLELDVEDSKGNTFTGPITATIQQ